MTKDNEGSAFPLFDGSAHYGGMTLRDYFAGQALQGRLADHSVSMSTDDRAENAYTLADAMIKARSET